MIVFDVKQACVLKHKLLHHIEASPSQIYTNFMDATRHTLPPCREARHQKQPQ
eukprot:m.111812 g.111812  ORF g.111812 m.111812 type:complete len:53 (+) comp13463_c0_seq3:90-248(+)